MVGKVFWDIKFWLFLLFVIRLVSINLPPLDEHAWRQTITLGVAKGYLEINSYFFEPKTVICDSREGILAQEFPILNYIIFLLWKIFGVHNWTYRLFNLIVATVGLYYFYLLVTRLFDRSVGFASTIVFAVSVAFMYARKAMPDVFAVSLCIIAIEYGYRYVEKQNGKDIFIFLLLLSIGLLSKMPASVVLPFGLYMLFYTKNQPKTNFIILSSGAFAIVLTVLWYFLWVPWATKTYQFPLYFPTSFSEGFKQLVETRLSLAVRFCPYALTSLLSFLAFVAGLIVAIKKKEKKILTIFSLSCLILIFFMLKTGSTFSWHVYYIIPFVPVMSLLAGYGISLLKKYGYAFYIFILVLTAEALYRHKYDFYIPEEHKKYLKLATISDQFIPENSRILVNDGGFNPRMMYLSNRRGWTVEDRMKDTSWVNGESTVGLHYMIIDKSKWKDTIPYPVLFEDEDFRLYKTIKQ